jgi:hypothetical protein
MASSFTHGNWSAVKTNGGQRVDSRNGTICSGIGWAPDAHLIAAAPDLYAALKGMMTGPENETHLKWEAAKAAVAKAEGRQS